MLYIIQQSNNNIYKIGISDNPEKRLKQLQTGNGNKLKLIKTFPVDNEETLEKKLHAMLWQNKQLLGRKNEWFRLDICTLEWLISYIQNFIS